MKVCVCNVREKQHAIDRAKNSNKGNRYDPLKAEVAGWKRGGEDIKYGPSKLTRMIGKGRQQFY